MKESMIFLLVGLFVFRTIEYFFGKVEIPKQKYWYLQLALIIGINYSLIGFGKIVTVFLFGKWTLLNLRSVVNKPVGAMIILIVLTFVLYWWHRIRHSNNFCWLVFHQLHHSPQRFEAALSLYKHPFEKISTTLIGSLIAFSFLGLTQTSLFYAHVSLIIIDYIAHLNVSTPKLLGYFIQRPEMHRLHHDARIYKLNFGHFTIWDRLFGTYRNPDVTDSAYGFGAQDFSQFLRYLLFCK